MELLGIAAVLLYLWAVLWMIRVRRSGPPVLNAFAETVVVIGAFPLGALLWWALRRRSAR